MKHRILFLSLLFVAGLLCVQAQPRKMPDTPASKRAQELLSLVQSANEASVKEFLADHVARSFRDRFSAEEHLEHFEQMRRDLTGAKVVGINMGGPNDISLILQASEGRLLRLRVEVESDPPHKITRIEVGEPKPSTGPRFSSFEELDRQLQKMTAEDRFSGVVYITRGGKVAFHKAYGLADRDRQIQNRTDTLFNIGSINKFFTGVAILRLVQEGKLNLDDPLAKYLKGFPPEIAGKVTIRQLLQHKSGWGDYLTHPKFTENPKQFKTVGDYLALFRTLPLEFEPGTRQRYSNISYVVLGGVIEAVTGRSYYDVIDDFVYRPAGMKSSGSFAVDEKGRNIAIGYTRMRNDAPAPAKNAQMDLKPNTNLFAPIGSPAGGGYSTTEDLSRFVDALLNNRLLDRRHTNLLLNRYSSDEENQGAWGIGGGARGINAVIELNSKTRDVVIVLANLDFPVAEEIGSAISSQLN